MNLGSFILSFNRFLFEGLAKNIFIATEYHALRQEGGRVELSPACRMKMIGKGGIKVSEYIDLLATRQYSAVFNDGSIFYVECIYNDRVISNHRYFFIPCPFVKITIESVPHDFGLVEWLRDSIDLEGVDVFSSKGIFRFDFARQRLNGAIEPHPLSHLTFASDQCRVPVRGPLQISSFLKFLFDNFFRDDRKFWLEFADGMSLGGEDETITSEETYLHHLSWEIPSKVGGSVVF